MSCLKQPDNSRGRLFGRLVRFGLLLAMNLRMKLQHLSRPDFHALNKANCTSLTVHRKITVSLQKLRNKLLEISSHFEKNWLFWSIFRLSVNNFSGNKLGQNLGGNLKLQIWPNYPINAQNPNLSHRLVSFISL